jgi:hypothetical protein
MTIDELKLLSPEQLAQLPPDILNQLPPEVVAQLAPQGQSMAAGGIGLPVNTSLDPQALSIGQEHPLGKPPMAPTQMDPNIVAHPRELADARADDFTRIMGPSPEVRPMETHMQEAAKTYDSINPAPKKEHWLQSLSTALRGAGAGAHAFGGDPRHASAFNKEMSGNAEKETKLFSDRAAGIGKIALSGEATEKAARLGYKDAFNKHRLPDYSAPISAASPRDPNKPPEKDTMPGTTIISGDHAKNAALERDTALESLLSRMKSGAGEEGVSAWGDLNARDTILNFVNADQHKLQQGTLRVDDHNRTLKLLNSTDPAELQKQLENYIESRDRL